LEKEDNKMSEHKEVWVFSENFDLTLEMLGKAYELAGKLQTETAALLLGQNLQEKAKELIEHGANKVYLIENPALKEFQTEPYLSALTSLAQHYKPNIILIGSTKRGKELAPRLATRLNTGCVPDSIKLDIDEQGRLVTGRVVYGGNAIATAICLTKPQIATVPPKTFEKPERKERAGQILQIDVKLEEPKTQIIEVKEIEPAKVKIEEAKIVICGGRGIEKKEDFKIIDELAQVLNAQVGYTRPLAEDRKWFTEWVGLSGHKIKPVLYIGCGISGVIQHVAGIRDSKIIVAINKDEQAPIHEVADYIIVGDLYQIIPAITEALKNILGKG
jgi:electron transfer flavoprotein alpha subunit